MFNKFKNAMRKKPKSGPPPTAHYAAPVAPAAPAAPALPVAAPIAVPAGAPTALIQIFPFNNEFVVVDKKSTNMNDISYWKGLAAIAQRDWEESYDYGDPTVYSDKKYALIKKKPALAAATKMRTLYEKDFSSKVWENGTMPPVSFTQDPDFVQKVNIVDRGARIAVIGDIHSSFHSMMDIIDSLNTLGFFVDDTLALTPNHYVFFTGDIVDRGPYSIELLCLIFTMKTLSFDNVYIINGNHEDSTTYTNYGLTQEVLGQFGTVSEDFLKTLHYLPSAIYLSFGGKKYHLSHGAFELNYAGFSRTPNTYNPSNRLATFLANSSSTFDLLETNPFTDFKWGDLSQSLPWYLPHQGNGRAQFGYNLIKSYLDNHEISAVIGGHQDEFNLGLLMNTGSDKLTTGKLVMIPEMDMDYDEYQLYTIKDIPMKPNIVVPMVPGDDFLGMTLSTATVSKPAWNVVNTYMILAIV